MDWIKLELAGDQIAITMQREVGHLSKVRHIRAQEALTLSLLLTGPAPEMAVNIDVSNGMAFQIENRPHERAWLEIDGRYGGGKLVACLEGPVIRKIGQSLHRLYIAAGSSSPTQDAAQSFPISYCYLEEEAT